VCRGARSAVNDRMTEYEKPRSIEEHQNECSDGVLMRMGGELRWGAARVGGQTRVGSSGGAPHGRAGKRGWGRRVGHRAEEDRSTSEWAMSSGGALAGGRSR
jgi:hypothetical protein